MTALAGRRIAVLGVGASGRAAQVALAAAGGDVTCFDDRPESQAAPMASLAPAAFDLVVASPGLAPHSAPLAACRAAGVEIVSEVEVAWWLRARPDAPWLAVTGTNGKTTTVQLLEAMLRAGGERAIAAGNVGLPLVQAVTEPEHDVFAVELSSFQLHHTRSMRAEAAAVLNIAPDHLDWHGSLDAYAAAKGRIYRGVTRACIFNAADPRTERLALEADVADGARAVGITRGVPEVGQLGIVEDLLIDRAFAPDRWRAGREVASFADLAGWAGPADAPAPHLLDDVLAASALALAHGTDPAAIRDALRAFRIGAHRLELVRELAEVRYVDDSKATNGHAAQASLDSMPDGRVVWLAGGLAKGADFDELVASRAHKLHAVVLIGLDPEPLRGSLARHAAEIPTVRIEPGDTGTVMQRAVSAARALARPGDTVLLAPACASMDQFVSYAHRGEAFAAAVAALDG